MGGHCRDADGQTIGRRLGHRIGADVAATAGPVLNDDGAQSGLNPLGQQPGGDVDRPTRRIRYNNANRLALCPWFLLIYITVPTRLKRIS